MLVMQLAKFTPMLLVKPYTARPRVTFCLSFPAKLKHEVKWCWLVSRLAV